MREKPAKLNQQLTEIMNVSVCGMYPGLKLFEVHPE